MGKVVIVEDDPSIAELVRLSLTTVGHEVTVAGNASDGRSLLSEDGVELAIIDITLPDEEGLALLPDARERGLPVVILTARDSLADKVRGLDAGADDYVTKPFEPLELIARVRAVLRRSPGSKASLRIGDVEIDAEARRVTRGGSAVDLTRREFDLLLCLAEHRGIALTREKLLELAWGYAYAGTTRTVDVHVQRLREKLGIDSITTVMGTGYRLEG